MGDIISSVVWVLVAITILVFVHEMGHFLLARLFKMRIDRFSIGFPPTIFKKKVGETEWAVGATPLGGYVKIAGMVDESMDTEFAGSDPEPWEYRSKPVWQRMIVISAGVIFNFILAAVIFTGIKAVVGTTLPMTTEDGLVFVADTSIAAREMGMQTGDRLIAVGEHALEDFDEAADLASLDDPLTFRYLRDGQEVTQSMAKSAIPMGASDSDGGLLGLGIYNWASVVGQLQEDGPAYAAGLRSGDRIVAIGGEPVQLWMQVTSRIQAAGEEALLFTWTRAETGESFTESITPEATESGGYRIGMQLAQVVEQYSIGAALRGGIVETWTFTGAIITSLKNVVTGRESVRESIGGPVMVAKITGDAAKAGAEPFWRLVALLSITLAIVNILPVPALDGGHLAFLIYEAIRRKEPSLKIRMAMQQFGMVLLLALMVFLVFNDLDRIFGFLQ